MSEADGLTPSPSEHLSTEEVAAYLNGAISRDERTRIESHLATCGPCCDEVVAHTQATEKVLPAWRRPTIAALAAAAAVAGVLLVGPGQRLLISDREPVFRDAQTPVEATLRPAIVALAPVNQVAVPRDSILFAWRPIADDAFYSLTLTDSEGNLAWRASTRDTLLALSSEVTLQRGVAYYWYVDALLPSGESPSTGVHRFTTR